MKLLVAIVIFATAFSLRAQTMINPFQALHPIMKDPNNRNAPTSLNQDPDQNERDEMEQRHQNHPEHRPGQSVGTLEPVDIIARVDDTFAISPLNLVGTVNGVKGTLYVTNTGSALATPSAEFAVCNAGGYLLNTAAKTGHALAPNESETLEVIANDLYAADLRLITVTSRR
jgi:hypothetical protein